MKYLFLFLRCSVRLGGLFMFLLSVSSVQAVPLLMNFQGRVTVDGTVQVGGTVARVGQRLIGSVAKMMMDRFFACLQDRLTSK